MCIGCQLENLVSTPEVDLEMQSLQLAVMDAKNSSQSIVGLQVRIDGEAVDASQLYADGKLLKAGSLALNNQACQLSCKNTGLKNAEFTIWASAPGYISNFKNVRVTALDSLQYVDVALVKLTDVNKEYLKQGKLKVGVLDRGTAWLDTGTFKSLMQAGQFVQVIADRQGLKVGCIEEVAYRMGYINAEQLRIIASPLVKSGYGKYLLNLLPKSI